MAEWLPLLTGTLGGGVGGVALAFLLRSWISERLQQSIRHEYSQKLENHKADLNTRIQEIRHEQQLNQLRTSLFFDHQRSAYAELLSKASELLQAWFDDGFDPEMGLMRQVPAPGLRDLRLTIGKHLLFLDQECVSAMELVVQCFRDSIPRKDPAGTPIGTPDLNLAMDEVEYLLPRVAELFQEKIGVASGTNAHQEICLLGGMKLINSYHFMDIEVPPKGALRVKKGMLSADIVNVGRENRAELVSKLEQLADHTRKIGLFQHVAADASIHVSIITSAGMRAADTASG